MNLAPKFIKLKRLPIENCIILENSESLIENSRSHSHSHSPQPDDSDSQLITTSEEIVIEETSDDESQPFQWINIEPDTFDRQAKKRLKTSSHNPYDHDCKTKEQIRRQTHNEIERRRRDKINTWINKLSDLLPQNMELFERNATVACDPNSKGGILAKACEYISRLKSTIHLLNHENRQLKDKCKRFEMLLAECNAAAAAAAAAAATTTAATKQPVDRTSVIQIRNK